MLGGCNSECKSPKFCGLPHHCPKKDPYHRDRVPLGTFLVFWVPIYISGSLFSVFGSGLDCWQILIFSNAYVLNFTNCCFGSIFWLLRVFFYNFLNTSYGWSKSTESEILSSSSKIVGVKKKRHGFIKPFWDLKWIGYQTYHVRTLFYSYDDPQCNIEAVSFFFNAANLPRKILRFDPTLNSHNSGLKPSNCEKYHIFGKPWTSAFTWLPLEKSY